METPVLLLVYNRLNTVKRVLAEINQAHPEKIYVAGDGPKKDDPLDSKKVEEVREYIQANIDRSIKVKTLFHSNNLGVKMAVYEAMKWFFSVEDKGIILEDDCLPGPVFFDYCEELLELYKDDGRIGMITGRNEFGKYENQFEGDYFLSTRSFIWGWATWKDRMMDLDIDIHRKLGIGDMISLFKNTSSLQEFIYRRKTISDLKEGKVDTWDYQWALSLLLNNRYTIVPKENMVKNIGLGVESTHKFQTSEDSVSHFKEKRELEHPAVLKVDKHYTQETVKKESGKIWKLLIPRFIIKIRRFFK